MAFYFDVYFLFKHKKKTIRFSTEGKPHINVLSSRLQNSSRYLINQDELKLTNFIDDQYEDLILKISSSSSAFRATRSHFLDSSRIYAKTDSTSLMQAEKLYKQFRLKFLQRSFMLRNKFLDFPLKSI
jgi:hypothetical protein